MPVTQDEGDQLISLTAAAQLMELDESLLEWALSNGLLQGEFGDDGVWYFDRKAVEEGRLPLEKQFSYLLETSALEGADDSSGHPFKSDDEHSALPHHTKIGAEMPEARELELLRKQLRDLNVVINEKDGLIADLARSLARMGEAAIERIPSQS